MEKIRYLVEKIDGDYAHLRNVDNGEEIIVAMALLPEETDEKMILLWENFSYSVE